MFIPEAGTLDAHTIHVDPRTRGLRDAAVWLEGVPRSPLQAALPEFEIDQRRYEFVPHVAAVRTGQPVRFRNSDVANHNVHSQTPGAVFNLGAPPGDGVVRRFERPTGARPVRIECDIHPWMLAWIYVFDHSAYAVTDKAGRFRLKAVRPGTYRMHVHHADGGLEKVVNVRLSPGVHRELRIVLP